MDHFYYNKLSWNINFNMPIGLFETGEVLIMQQNIEGVTYIIQHLNFSNGNVSN